MLIFFKTILEVIFMQRRKQKLSARLQIYIEVQALDISLKAKNIYYKPNNKKLIDLIL